MCLNICVLELFFIFTLRNVKHTLLENVEFALEPHVYYARRHQIRKYEYNFFCLHQLYDNIKSRLRD